MPALAKITVYSVYHKNKMFMFSAEGTVSTTIKEGSTDANLLTAPSGRYECRPSALCKNICR